LEIREKMPVNRPYRRTCRQFTDGKYHGEYIYHQKYAQSPEHYVRAFLLLLKDLQNLFDYIEPADKNLSCYSYRIHALLLRTCVEVEANCKAILKENGYVKRSEMNINDYKKINTTHRLSSYQVKIPIWNGAENIRSPFLPWASGNILPWYRAYNTTKHDRHEKIEEATFEHLLDATCGLLVILSAQFKTCDFRPGPCYIIVSEFVEDGMRRGIGEYFLVKFPDDWPDEMKYEFDWQTLKDESDPFQTIDYNQIS
jgi:hypothetical protein